jgi:hypothetical protein
MRTTAALGGALTALASLTAQSVTASLSALTPLSVQFTNGVVVPNALHPVGPLAATGLLRVGSATSEDAAVTAWSAQTGATQSFVRLEQALYSPLPNSQFVGRAGAHELLVEFAATGAIDARLRIDRVVDVTPGVPGPLVELDFDNDGVIDVTGPPVGQPVTLTRSLATPLRIRVVLDSRLVGTGSSSARVDFLLTPENDVTVSRSIVECLATWPPPPFLPPPPPFAAPAFAGRGVHLTVPPAWTGPAVLVLGTSAQPTLIGVSSGLPCWLLPTPQIVLYEPSGGLTVPLPAALRPLTFFAQAVGLADGGLIVGDGCVVAAH